MENRSVVIFGAGRMGSAMARVLFDSDIEVMIVDKDPDKIQDVANEATTAVIADVLDDDAMEELGLGVFDIAIIAIGSSLEASIVAAVEAKEAGIPMIYAKSSSEMQSKILEKLGVDKILNPEIDMGERLAKSIAEKNILEYIHFSEDYSIVEINAPKEWANKSLLELDVRNKYHINIIAIRRGRETKVTPLATEEIRLGDKLIIIGDGEALEKIEDKD